MKNDFLPSFKTAGFMVMGLLLATSAGGLSVRAQEAPAADVQKVRTEIPYGDGTVVLVSDFQERISATRYRASGNVEIRYQDALITADEAQFDEETRQGFTSGETRFNQSDQWLTCSRAEFNFSNQTGTFYNATGFVDREFLIRGRTVTKTGPDTYKIEGGFVTACQEPNPKWSFAMSSASIRVDSTAQLRNVVFRVKGVPVFYSPYMIVPLERKSRSSGLLPFHVGNSNTKGFMLRLGYFQTLGSTADITVHGDYYSDRGLGVGGVFRARPNQQTRIHIETWGIDDKLGQGGAHLLVDGQSRFENGFRTVASVNITTNFRFRQAFMESFRTATIPEERSVLFLTRNQDSFSTNIVFQRDEILFPVRSLVIRKSPSIEFFSLGHPLGPLSLSLRASAEAISRIDKDYETPKMVQRLDFYPRASLRLPSFGGFSLKPSIGVRGTYYSARLTGAEQPEVLPKSLRRHIVDVEIDLRTPSIERGFSSSFGDLKHVVEPFTTYRRIHGVKHLEETIRFDEQDAIADTNEFEYGIVNRFYHKRETGSGMTRNHEFLSFRIAQKYYLDPTFGGTFKPGSLNIFYPLNTLTGFAATGMERRFSPISMSARLSPKPGISHDVRLDYDTKLSRLRNASVSSYWQQEKVFIAGTYFKSNALEPDMIESHHVQGQLGYGSVTEGLSASISLSYNLQSSSLLNIHSRLHYGWDCCGVALEYQHFNLGLRTERRFNFSFTLKGIGSFGSLKRPESLF